ncbi:hypothetical protein BN1723_011905 [Verticillium longisporum]|uniref:Uncharacterized protein n=1 Tax=Verticillium longisporum TaxID=100787 RepID=A0A0G4LCU8_VERLO|nr:hypothetical protein BN1723_011905 [Verticillium longisporum]
MNGEPFGSLTIDHAPCLVTTTFVDEVWSPIVGPEFSRNSAPPQAQSCSIYRERGRFPVSKLCSTSLALGCLAPRNDPCHRGPRRAPQPTVPQGKGTDLGGAARQMPLFVILVKTSLAAERYLCQYSVFVGVSALATNAAQKVRNKLPLSAMGPKYPVCEAQTRVAHPRSPEALS